VTAVAGPPATPPRAERGSSAVGRAPGGGAGAGSPPPPEVRVFPDAGALAAAAADEVVRALGAAIAERGTASLVLSGGSTPRPVYRLLGEPPRRGAVDWGAVQIFWGDERAVPPSHPESNFRLAREALLSRVPLAPGSVHRIAGELPAAEAAAAYETALRAALGEELAFDLVLLGLGADGHTASLFPGDDAGEGRTAAGRAAVAASAPEPPRGRVTLTYEALAAAREVVFLVVGEGKAEAAARALAGVPAGTDAAGADSEDAQATDVDGEGAGAVGRGDGTAPGRVVPAARVRPRSGRVLWLLDAAAVSRLPEGAR